MKEPNNFELNSPLQTVENQQIIPTSKKFSDEKSARNSPNKDQTQDPNLASQKEDFYVGKHPIGMKNPKLENSPGETQPYNFAFLPRALTPQPLVPKIPVKYNDVNWSKINSSLTHIRDDISNFTEKNKIENLKLGRERAITKDRARTNVSCHLGQISRSKSPTNIHLAALT